MKRIGIIQFPGSLDDDDAIRAVNASGAIGIKIFHKESALPNLDAVIIPGGFSYGDYLRCGAIARFAPIMESVIEAAHDGMPVLGICNGFQILCEANLLPGALTRNRDLYFICRDQKIVIETNTTQWTTDFQKSEEIIIPLKNGEGAYQCSKEALDELISEERIVARYSGENPNGSVAAIAGITNAARNVVGIMPHPEHAISTLTGPTMDGLRFFTSVSQQETAKI